MSRFSGVRGLWRVLVAAMILVGCLSLANSAMPVKRPVNKVFVDRRGVPDWGLDRDHPKDVFTFVRIMYNPRGGNGWGNWQTDYPDSDLNLSFRLQQVTSLKVDPNPIVIELTDPRLFDYPFIYLLEAGHYPGLNLTPEETANLRRYLDNGGFLMVDDFWGEAEWNVFHHEIKKVFPDRDFVDLTLDHPIFHCVYDLKFLPQVPAIEAAIAGRATGRTWEREDAKTPHYRAFFDDNGRMMAMICHNTDLGDGWEREGEDEWYFRTFSEPQSYPLGINIIYYAMTH